MISGNKGYLVSKKFMFYLLAFLALVEIFFPFYWMFTTGTGKPGNLLKYPPSLISLPPVLNSFKALLDEKPVLLWIKNSTFVAFSSTFLALFVSIPAAYSLSRFKYRFRNGFSYLILLTQMLPAILFLIPLFFILKTFGLLNNLFSLVFVHGTFSTPVCIWLLKGFFKKIPKSVEEAGMIDGCSQFSILTKITLPLSYPGLVAIALFSFLNSWNEYIVTLTIAGGVSDKWVLSVGLSNLIGQYYVPWDSIMVGGLIGITVPMFFCLVFQKYIRSGLIVGGVKG